MRHLREIVTKEREREREREKERQSSEIGAGDVVATHITAATVSKPRVTSSRPDLRKRERDPK